MTSPDQNYTSGPWSVVHGEDQPSPMYVGLVCMIEKRDGGMTAVVTGPNGAADGRVCPKEDWEANAHLIAAAPDLYVALKDAVTRLQYAADYFHDIGDDQRASADWAAAEVCRVALSKAKPAKAGKVRA